MVDLLAGEGEIAGLPLTVEEREILAGGGAMADELSAKARLLIGRVFDKETREDSDPRSFSNAMLWATDPAWPNVAELVAQVVAERNPDRRLRGWARVKDMLQLVGCGLLVVLLMLAVVIAFGLFHWK